MRKVPGYRRAFSTGILLCLSSVMASGIDFEIGTIPSPQRAGVAFPVTITAHETNGAPATNFSGPIRLVFQDAPAPVLAATFNSGLSGWTCGCQSGGNFFNPQFDTDGDGTSDGSLALSLNSQVCWSYTTVSLVSGLVYTVSMDLAFRAGPVGGNQLLSVDTVINSTQVGVWTLGRIGPNETARATVQTTFVSPVTGTALLNVRFWAPLSTSATAYMDNVAVQERELDPVVVQVFEGEGTADVRSYREGSNLVLRVQGNSGQMADSNPFDVLPWAIDASVSIQDQGPLPSGVANWLTVAVSNAGPSRAEGLRLTNESPENVMVPAVGLYSGCFVINNSVVCDLPPIESGSTFLLNIPIVARESGTAEFHASLEIKGHDSDPLNHEAVRNVQFVPLVRGSNVVVTEHEAGTNSVFVFELTAAGTEELSVGVQVAPLSAAVGYDYTMPTLTTLVFPVGITQQVVTVAVLNDAYWETNEQFVVRLARPLGMPLLLEQTEFLGNIISDDPLPNLTLLLPSALEEEATVVNDGGTLLLSAPLDRDLTVSLRSSDETELVVPEAAVIPAGETNVSFDLQVNDDAVYDPAQNITVYAETAIGISADGSMVVEDNELPPLTLAMATQSPFREGAGTVVNGLRISVPAALDTNVTIQLTSSDTTELTVDSTVMLNAGLGTLVFPAMIVDDADTDGSQWVTVNASAPGFANGSITFLVRDNDVHRFRFGGKQGSVTSTVPFAVTFTAVDFSNITITAFSGPVTLSATGSLGKVVLQPATVTNFSRGTWSGSVTILNGAHTDVRLFATDAEGLNGFSESFTVYAAPEQATRIASVSVNGSDVQMGFTSVAGRSYRVEFAHAPQGPWDVLLGNMAGTGAMISLTHTGALQQVQQFYRVVLTPDPTP